MYYKKYHDLAIPLLMWLNHMIINNHEAMVLLCFSYPDVTKSCNNRNVMMLLQIHDFAIPLLMLLNHVIIIKIGCYWTYSKTVIKGPTLLLSSLSDCIVFQFGMLRENILMKFFDNFEYFLHHDITRLSFCHHRHRWAQTYAEPFDLKSLPGSGSQSGSIPKLNDL